MKAIIDYKAISDEMLIRLYKDSDAKAFSEIFARYGSKLLRYTYRRIKTTEDSADLIHEAFTELWHKRKRIIITGELELFLIEMIKKRILSFYKNTKMTQEYIDRFNAYLNSEKPSS